MYRLSIILEGKKFLEGKLEDFGSDKSLLPARRLIFLDGFHGDK